MEVSTLPCLLLVSTALALCRAAAARPESATTNLDAATMAAQERDRVASLPGAPSYPYAFKHYSGYVTTDERLGKALFYWFFEAMEKPDEKPLVLWLNGGPGCSSVGFGQAQELGPFLVKKDVPELELNPCQLAVPGLSSGVGFSYTNTSFKIDPPGDNSTGMQHRYMFPLLYRNKEGFSFILCSTRFIRFPRQIGNAYMDGDTDLQGIVDSSWHHAIISDTLYETYLRSCNFSAEILSRECEVALGEFSVLNNLIDIYSLYAPNCERGYPDFNTSSSPQIGPTTSRFDLLRIPMGYDPCTQTYATEYLNREDVQRALHANTTGVPYPYSLCRDSINVLWHDSDKTVLPIVRKLAQEGLRIWIFSGDTDGRIPTTSTRYTLKKLGLPIKEDWSPWFTHKQVGGWSVVYDGLTFVTVRGAGHMVPTSRPEQALQLFEHFLANHNLPSKPF
uniref:carboxypeptidase D n=1 Tax=Aegilops tauschii TaxID=37682 RepID=M8D852_AEGTA